MSRRRRTRGRTKSSGSGWIYDLFESGLEALLDFLFSWGRR